MVRVQLQGPMKQKEGWWKVPSARATVAQWLEGYLGPPIIGIMSPRPMRVGRNTHHCANEFKCSHAYADISITNSCKDNVLMRGNQVWVARDNLCGGKQRNVFHCNDECVSF